MIDIVQEYIIEQFDNIVYSLDFGMEELNELNLEWIDFLESVDWNKNYVVLERTIEGYFPNDSMELLHEEIRKHKYPANKIIFLTSDLKIEKNYNNWKLKSKFKDDVPINVIGIAGFFPDVMHLVKREKNHREILLKNILVTNERDKLFLFLTRKMWPYKEKFFNKIKSIGGLDVSIYSAIDYGIYLDDEEHFKSGGSWNEQKKYELSKYYENTYFETFCNCDIDEIDGRIFLCEKNVKPLLHGQPFISLSYSGTLEVLRGMGFETYPELFDESYDDEVNIWNRFKMVVKEIKRYIDMWNKNKSKVHQIFTQENILEKRKHNQNWVIYHNPVLPDLYYKLGRIIT
jgi:hypothetical protein